MKRRDFITVLGGLAAALGIEVPGSIQLLTGEMIDQGSFAAGSALHALLNDDEIAMQVTHWYNCCAVSARRSRFVAFVL